MRTYNTTESLNFGISLVIEDIVSEIMHELNIELHDRIEHNVYEAYKGWYYEQGYRTNEFLESFVLSNLSDIVSWNNVNIIEREIYHDPTLMTKYTGFPYSHYQRDELAEIIESGEGYLIADDSEIPARPFWDEWIEWCIQEIPKRFKTKCHSKGLYLE